MKLLLLLILVLPTAALAEKKLTAKDMSMLGKIDENTIKNAEPTKPTVKAQDPAAEAKFSISCKDINGREFKTGEAGYDDCLSQLKMRNNTNKLNSGINKENNKDASSANLNFKIGE